MLHWTFSTQANINFWLNLNFQKITIFICREISLQTVTIHFFSFRFPNFAHRSGSIQNVATGHNNYKQTESLSVRTEINMPRINSAKEFILKKLPFFKFWFRLLFNIFGTVKISYTIKSFQTKGKTKVFEVESSSTQILITTIETKNMYVIAFFGHRIVGCSVKLPNLTNINIVKIYQKICFHWK